MKKHIILFSSILLLNACAATMNGVAQDSANMVNNASQFAHENRDKINTVAEQTGELLKRGGNLIGKGMTATGEMLQEMTTE
ncbi:hypothetical protein [Alysiella crassa]|uniref:Lipoprotein n=1 Tax=Alysiella crassa TaxID=153491 RepID=A0A376BN82_9NEIS|nr:hypothetical protein [Alysiella crassa]UOP06780.1 hypothetical protein LVJ80_13875 [Alysiella crassa]SSY71103.1 Uncharacterised protein [Alysiella crassa]